MKPRWIRPLTLLLVIVYCLAGCATSARRTCIAKMNLAKQGALACIIYADAHGEQYPPDIQAIAGIMKTNYFEQLTANFDLVYTGVATNIAKPAQTIILKEKKPWQAHGGNWLKAYAFADGHCEIHAAPDGKFAEWENEHLVKP